MQGAGSVAEAALLGARGPWLTKMAARVRGVRCAFDRTKKKQTIHRGLQTGPHGTMRRDLRLDHGPMPLLLSLSHLP
jgi:hypothetical protein